MNYVQFVLWAGKHGFKYGQRYLNQVWREATKGGKQVLESHFPKLLNKAKDYYKNFKGADLKPVKPKRFKWDPFPTKRLRAIVDKHKAKTTTQIKAEGLAKTLRVVEGAKKGITGVNKPGFNPSLIKGSKKADGGRIDKALPTRSRDI